MVEVVPCSTEISEHVLVYEIALGQTLCSLTRLETCSLKALAIKGRMPLGRQVQGRLLKNHLKA